MCNNLAAKTDQPADSTSVPPRFFQGAIHVQPLGGKSSENSNQLLVVGCYKLSAIQSFL